MGRIEGNYAAGGNAGEARLPAPPPDRTPEELNAWRARNEAKSSRSSGIVRRPIVTEPIVTEPIVTEPIVTEPVVTEALAADEPAAVREFEVFKKPKPAPRKPPSKRPNTTARNAAIVTAYAAGDSATQVGERFGLTSTRVYQILAKAGVARRPRPGQGPKPDPIDVLVEEDEPRTCSRCHDAVDYLSTDDLCDGCVAEGDEPAMGLGVDVGGAVWLLTGNDGYMAYRPDAELLLNLICTETPAFALTLTEHAPKIQPILDSILDAKAGAA